MNVSLLITKTVIKPHPDACRILVHQSAYMRRETFVIRALYMDCFGPEVVAHLGEKMYI